MRQLVLPPSAGHPHGRSPDCGGGQGEEETWTVSVVVVGNDGGEMGCIVSCY